ncbi:MAG: C39 family peptidase [Candidatus Cloacimonetes bacterium]|jgi:hypothetical protein|nr:C39 family peptidase [Candidatus Cloacimonadota bacterium]
MKKLVFLLLLCLMSVLYAQNRQVSLSEAKSVADRNARALWGNNLGSATPIPYYGPDDTIIAWHFNYAINKAFPDEEVLKQSCDDALASGNRELGQGKDEYANMVVGANRDMPIFIERSKTLSPQYFLGKLLEREAAKVFPKGYEIEKTYYLGLVDLWYLVRSGKDVIYINLEPYPRVKTAEEFQKMLSTMTFFWQRDSFEEDWVAFLDNNETMSRSEVMIPGEELMPFYEWSYGCTPTAAAMHLAWWDIVRGYGKLIDYHLTRWDTKENVLRHHVPSIQTQLANFMSTNISTGGTSDINISDGYIDTIEARGYECDVDGDYIWPNNTISHLWANVVGNINSQIPLHIGVTTDNPDVGHSIVGVGYISSPKQVHTHDPNMSTVRTISRSLLDSTWEVTLSEGYLNHAEIITPNGGTEWGGNGGGNETLYSGDMYDITWTTNLPAGSYAKINYNYDGGSGSWHPIDLNTPNDGHYLWHVPELVDCPYGISTSMARVRIDLYRSNGELVARDASYGNFNIIGGVGMPDLGQISRKP